MNYGKAYQHALVPVYFYQSTMSALSGPRCLLDTGRPNPPSGRAKGKKSVDSWPADFDMNYGKPYSTP
jgi:hypothetical protein